jgi:tRNA pseudouridine38-40 synthase
MAAQGTRRIALRLEYDGTGYSGSQLQDNGVTIQGVLEDAIRKTTGETVRAAFAGRTDAGVHARGQVATFTTSSCQSLSVMRKALNAWLPEDVAVLEAADVLAEFDVRRHAKSRHYRYLISDRSVKTTLERQRSWHVSSSLDCARMAIAAQRLIGLRDFKAFAGPMERDDASTVRDLQQFQVRREGDILACDVVANAFLPHQVRRMVGALVEVGRERRTPDEYEALLDGPPASAGPCAPAHGLYLLSVDYDTPLFHESAAASERRGLTLV